MAVEIDPEILAVRAAMAAHTGPFDIMALPPADGRRLIDAAAQILNDGQPEVAAVEDHDVGGMRVRVYTPRDVRSDGWLYYLHGGGWFACSVDTHDRMLRMLSE
ncbi:MAG: alpha/beta hydrolase, partial [Sphingopyxis sp.]|nr:alpha/beta hydrolase [Sphingopyxis sp.]